MKYNIIDELLTMKVFKGISSIEMESMMVCLGTYMKDYTKEQYIILSEDVVDAVGLILSGDVQMIREDLWGNKTLLVSMKYGDLFGETFACGVNNNATVSFIASTNSKIMFIPFNRIMHTCSSSCRFHHTLIQNMITLIAEKNANLMDKVDILSKKTLREKISTYLLNESGKYKSLYFDISFGRVQWAEYLNADRSALTRELNAMRDEGMIEFDKNSFHILRSLE